MAAPGILNEGQENEMELFGYKKKKLRQILCILGYVFTLGFLRLLFYWRPELDVWSHCTSCNLEEAEVILLRTTDEFKKYTKKTVQLIQADMSLMNSKEVSKEQPGLGMLLMKSMVRCIKVQKTRFVWNPLEGQFKKIGVLEENLSCSDIHTKYGLGLSREEQNDRRRFCGPNTIDVEIIPLWKLLVKEILDPFYFFEMYAVSVWVATGYYEYSMAIFSLTILSVLVTIYLLRMQSRKLHRMVEAHNNVIVSVLHKNGEVEEMQSKYLVPGDVIILSEKKFSLPCDAILVSGGCVINESLLTGESVPVTKVSLPNVDNGIPWKTYTGENYRAHVLYCGTDVIKTMPCADGLVKAVVLQTGFNTTKGDLVRSIMYPKPVNFKLHKEVMKALYGLIAISMAGVIYVIACFAVLGASTEELVIMALVMATIGVPVSLPPALTICTLYSQARLRKQGIFCISPQRIVLCGQLNAICFDKTGTLTEDGLDLCSIISSEGSCFEEVYPLCSDGKFPWGSMTGAMATCHSLVLMDGKVHGDPLDIKMFEGTGWELKEWQDETSKLCTTVIPGADMQCVPVKGFSIFHQYPFTSALQRMSVIAEVLGEPKYTVFSKGAPEVMVQLCKQETVPSNFSYVLDKYTAQGFRVIGLAYKDIQLNESSNFEPLESSEKPKRSPWKSL